MNEELKNHALNDEVLENVTGGVIGSQIYDDEGNDNSPETGDNAFRNKGFSHVKRNFYATENSNIQRVMEANAKAVKRRRSR